MRLFSFHSEHISNAYQNHDSDLPQLMLERFVETKFIKDDNILDLIQHPGQHLCRSEYLESNDFYIFLANENSK